MPTVLRYRNLRFFFFSNEGSPREPVHVHVEGDGGEAKLWLAPEVTVARSAGFNRRQLSELVRVAIENREAMERTWHEYFG